MASRNQEEKKTEPSFENSIERLESIVEQMESDKLPLEDLLVRYEEGIKLVKFCSEKLNAAEKRIEIITREAGGKPKLAEFEADQTATANEAPDDESDDVRLF
jgi:exodeoxyribonuclease VII small subunit